MSGIRAGSIIWISSLVAVACAGGSCAAGGGGSDGQGGDEGGAGGETSGAGGDSAPGGGTQEGGSTGEGGGANPGGSRGSAGLNAGGANPGGAGSGGAITNGGNGVGGSNGGRGGSAGGPNGGAGGTPGSTSRWILGGYDVRTVLSIDGQTWTNDQRLPPNGENIIYSLANGAGMVIASSNDGFRSTRDGITWAKMSAFTGGGFVAYGAGRFVALSGGSQTSTDGVNWTKHPNPLTNGQHAQFLFGGGHFLLYGDLSNGNAFRMVSENGETWHDLVSGGTQLRSVSHGNGMFLGTLSGSDYATSPDGVTWTPRNTGGKAIDRVAFGGGVFLACGGGGCAYSADGIAWTNAASPPQAGALVAGNGAWVVARDTSIYFLAGKSLQWKLVHSNNDAADKYIRTGVFATLFPAP